MRSWKLIHTLSLGSLALIAAALFVPAVTHSQNRGHASQRVQLGQRRRHLSDNHDLSYLRYHQPLLQTPWHERQNLRHLPSGRTGNGHHPRTTLPRSSPRPRALIPSSHTVDGANAPNLDMSTVAKRQANCSMLLTRGLIRVNLSLPATAEFTLAAVDDPYHYANAQNLSCFRRPLPTTNLRFLSTVMWDGRELLDAIDLQDALESQVKDAVLTHMQGKTPPSAAQVAQIIDFETHLYTAQIYDNNAGSLTAPGIDGGPTTLMALPFFPGINKCVRPGTYAAAFR